MVIEAFLASRVATEKFWKDLFGPPLPGIMKQVVEVDLTATPGAGAHILRITYP